ncbi:hypothetical protein PO909_004547 [Leuciscus waleckii]
MIQNGCLSIMTCEPKAATVFVPEPELATIRAPESTRDAQSIPEPGADLCLIDLWSLDPVPSRVPTLESSPSTPVPPGDLDAPVPSRNLPPSMFPPSCLVSSPLLVMSSPLDPSAPLVLSNSSALPPR